MRRSGPDMSQSMDPQRGFEEIYTAHADRVHAYARRRLISPAGADEVVADVFLVAWRRLDRVPAEPLPWLLAVARRVLANRRRAEVRHVALHERLFTLVRSSEPTLELPDRRVGEALNRLSAVDRELLLLTAWEGLDQSEVAAMLGVRPGTVAMRLHRARQRFAAALAAHDDDVPRTVEVRR